MFLSLLVKTTEPCKSAQRRNPRYKHVLRTGVVHLLLGIAQAECKKLPQKHLEKQEWFAMFGQPDHCRQCLADQQKVNRATAGIASALRSMNHLRNAAGIFPRDQIFLLRQKVAIPGSVIQAISIFKKPLRISCPCYRFSDKPPPRSFYKFGCSTPPFPEQIKMSAEAACSRTAFICPTG